MKAILAAVVLALVAAGVALALTFRAEVLPTGDAGALVLPDARPPAELAIAVVHAGKMSSSAGFAYRGGALGERRDFGMAGVLVRHPRGSLLIDAGFGANVDRHVETIPWLMRATTRYEKERPVAEQLRAAGVDLNRLAGIVLTHAHWDHVSGVEDFGGTRVWVTQAELDFIRSGDPATALARGMGELSWHVYGFPDGAYLGFDASYDVFRDGSVVIVPAGGHTPGSVIVFVTVAGGTRYAFIGDLAWQKEAVELPAERPWLSRRLVDRDAALVRQRLVQLHHLARQVPNLVIVPAHDRRVLESLPAFR